MNIKIGDYIEAYNRDLYRIVNLYIINDNVLIDLRKISQNNNVFCNILGVNIKDIGEFGIIIPEESIKLNI